ncbi:unnamed protein product [Caenorhabditis auriculariae]|uniref:Secreted protein n=1 Tax=Caenorhabditis auriculariae TaxID=2777116 RepID=A0A8S1HA69_9PELO|nr:unnamed protein product [Caenorhabditis auriculariae]
MRLWLLVPTVILPFFSTVQAGANLEVLTNLACEQNPKLSICKRNRETKSVKTEERDEVVEKEEMIMPPPMPFGDRKKDVAKSIDKAVGAKKEVATLPQLTDEEARVLQAKCAKVAPLVQEHCAKGKVTAQNAGRCAAYFRDCGRFIPRSDPLGAIANSWSSGVNINLATVGVNGIPYYPINEEGGVGVGVGLGIPFGAWGGGASTSVGVRDYFQGDQEAGANWYDGKYGYKNHWSIPLVQSLGVEGGQHNTVGFPLHGPNAGVLNVDNGYGVGGYYGHNDHVGVDWRRGDVVHNFGVGVPFAGVGVNTGQAVSFPSLDTFLNAGKK